MQNLFAHVSPSPTHVLLTAGRVSYVAIASHRQAVRKVFVFTKMLGRKLFELPVHSEVNVVPAAQALRDEMGDSLTVVYADIHSWRHSRTR